MPTLTEPSHDIVLTVPGWLTSLYLGTPQSSPPPQQLMEQVVSGYLLDRAGRLVTQAQVWQAVLEANRSTELPKDSGAYYQLLQNFTGLWLEAAKQFNR